MNKHPAREHASKVDTSIQQDLVQAIPHLRAFAISLCGDRVRADDLVQETLVKAWNNLATFTGGTNFKAWLFTILRNTYFSQLRKYKREVEDANGAISSKVAVHGEQMGHMDFQDFEKALQQLSPDQREAITLIGAEDFTYEQVAEISGCAVGTIKSRVNRARKRLAELLEVSKAAEYGPQGIDEAVVAKTKKRELLTLGSVSCPNLFWQLKHEQRM